MHIEIDGVLAVFISPLAEGPEVFIRFNHDKCSDLIIKIQ